MKIYITDFYHIRFFTPNMIPVATSGGWPYWIYEYNKEKRDTFFLDKNNVINGIVEERFSKGYGENFDNLTERCGEAKPCPYLNKVPHCQFMDSYYEYLKQQDFNSLLVEFERIASEVKKINHYEGEPIIVLIVYESSKCLCAERPCIRKWFEDNGYELPEFTKEVALEQNGEIF